MIRVAIFDDNDALRQSLASFLDWDEELDVVGQFPDVNSVEENVLAVEPDVVLMDIEMPGTSGIEGVKRLRTVLSNAQIMMLTVFEDDENIFAALKAGANGYLLKKTPPAQILEAVKDLYNGGSPMNSIIARKVLHHFHPAASKHDPQEQLTAREKEILDLLIKGNSYKMIAVEFNISQNTVRNHIQHIYEKLHVNSAMEAAYKVFLK